MDIYDVARAALVKAQKLSTGPKTIIMHPETAEKLIGSFLGVKCSIQGVCPKDQIFVTHLDSPTLCRC